MKKRDHKAEWSRRSQHSKIHNWNKRSDKKKGLENNLTLDQTKIIISAPCYYCGKPNAGGVERIDCSLGHVIGNCIPACKECNLLLVDLPFDAKLLLRDGLRQIRERGLFDKWTPAFLRLPEDSKDVQT